MKKNVYSYAYFVIVYLQISNCFSYENMQYVLH